MSNKKTAFSEFQLESGEKLSEVSLVYETLGSLSPEKSNAVLIFHALSGDANVSAWWPNMVGPGKAFDTDKYFIICANTLGGCAGSTGPSSVNPKTGRPYGLDFPLITIKDMLNAQMRLLDSLGISKLHVASGGSMGGMLALQMAVSYPERVENVIPIATSARTSAQNIAFSEVGRRAIIHDPNWKQGNYYGGVPPSDGLGMARMLAHITYLSDKSMRSKFGRAQKEGAGADEKFILPQFEVESYLQHKGFRFTERFDANTYLYITKAIDLFNLAEEKGGSLSAALSNCKSRFLVIYFTSDWLFPEYQSLEIVDALKDNFASVSYRVIESNCGHDAFLLETEELTLAIKSFLKGAKTVDL